MKQVVLIGMVAVLAFSPRSRGNIGNIVQNPLQPPDTSSPAATLYGFIEDMNLTYRHLLDQGRANISREHTQIITNRIQRYLDRSALPEHVQRQASIEAAISLKEILDRVSIPDRAAIAPGSSETRWRIPGTDLVIERQEEGPFEGEYLFSARTVVEAEELFQSVSHLPVRTEGPGTTENMLDWYRSTPSSPVVATIVDLLPTFFRNPLFGHRIWQWTGLILILTGGMVLMRIAYKVGRARAKAMQEQKILRYFLTLAFPITAVLIPLGMKYMIRHHLVLSGPVLRLIDFVLGLLLLVSVMRLIWAIGNRLLALVLANENLHRDVLDAQIIRLAGRVVTVLVVIIVFLEGGKRLGIPLSTLVAGAGISGFAVAMAAQDSLKNILGSVMLILDKPFEVGDRIFAKGFDGIVKEIGLRSTKLELLTGHDATLPNEELARTEIENVSRRPFIRRILDLKIALDTPHTAVRNAITGIETLLENHEGMMEDFPARIYFFDYINDAQMIRIIYWYAPPAYWDYLAFNQQVNLEISRILEEEGISLLLPTRFTSTEEPGGHQTTASMAQGLPPPTV